MQNRLLYHCGSIHVPDLDHAFLQAASCVLITRYGNQTRMPAAAATLHTESQA